MKLNWRWVFVTIIALAVVALPFARRLFIPNGGYGMMRGSGIGMQMPMMNYGYSITPFHGALAPFGMWFMWLIPLGVFVLIGFAFGWAANQFTHKQN